jgi:hypothetical protein
MEKNIITSDGNIRKGNQHNCSQIRELYCDTVSALFVLLWARTVVGHLIYPFLLNHERHRIQTWVNAVAA